MDIIETFEIAFLILILGWVLLSIFEFTTLLLVGIAGLLGAIVYFLYYMSKKFQCLPKCPVYRCTKLSVNIPPPAEERTFAL